MKSISYNYEKSFFFFKNSKKSGGKKDFLRIILRSVGVILFYKIILILTIYSFITSQLSAYFNKNSLKWHVTCYNMRERNELKTNFFLQVRLPATSGRISK